eukprot:SAG31_NODE_785_length_12089_cov_4.342936_10_plen_84_part_00
MARLQDLAVSNVIDGSTSSDLKTMAAAGPLAVESAASRIREFTGKRGRGPHRLSVSEVILIRCVKTVQHLGKLRILNCRNQRR